MTDERFDRDLTAVLREVAGDGAPTSLRYRLRAITDAPPAGRPTWFAPLVQLATAAVVVAVGAVLGWNFLQGPIVGVKPTSSPEPTSSAPAPTESPTQSESPSPTQSESPSPTQSQSPSQSPSTTPLPSGWTGLYWSDPVVPSTQDGLRIEDIAPWGEGYVAVGETGVTDPSTVRGAFLASPDGLTWTVVQTADLQRSGELMTHVFVVGGRLLATAEGGGVDCPADTACPTPDFSPDLWTSTNGSHWTLVDSPSWHAGWSNAGAPIWMVAGDAGIIAVGYEGRGMGEPGQPPAPNVPMVLHSQDGRTWEQADLAEGFDHAVLRDAVAFPDGFVIVGRDGVRDPATEVVDGPYRLGLGRPAAWVSADGVHWTVAEVDGIEIEGGELSDVEVGADGLFAIGAGSPIAGDATSSGWVSVDGATWHVVGKLGIDLPAIDQGINQVPGIGSTVLASDGRHIFVLDREAPGSQTMAAWVSTDGATWVRLSFAGSTSLPKIGRYDGDTSQGMYVTGATVLPDRIAVSGSGAETYALWLATAVRPDPDARRLRRKTGARKVRPPAMPRPARSDRLRTRTGATPASRAARARRTRR